MWIYGWTNNWTWWVENFLEAATLPWRHPGHCLSCFAWSLTLLNHLRFRGSRAQVVVRTNFFWAGFKQVLGGSTFSCVLCSTSVAFLVWTHYPDLPLSHHVWDWTFTNLKQDVSILMNLLDFMTLERRCLCYKILSPCVHVQVDKTGKKKPDVNSRQNHFLCGPIPIL